jgi:transposase
MRVRVKKRYDEAFKRQSVQLLERTEQTLPAVARSLGVHPATLDYWYKTDMAKRRIRDLATAATAPPTETVEQKLARLERENAALHKEIEELRVDKEILKKAAAFFVRESK